MINKIYNLFNHILRTSIGKRNKIKVIKNIIELQIRKRLFNGSFVFKTCTDTYAFVENGIDTSGASALFYCGILEAEEVMFCWHLLRENNIFFDIGANQGAWGLILCAKGVICHEFEASSETFVSLKKQKSLNEKFNDKFVIHNLAVSDKNGFVEFTMGRGQNNQIKSNINKYKGKFHKDSYENVEAYTLDFLAEKYGFPSVVKIDTEGFTKQVLAEGKKVLESKSLKALVIETFRNNNSSHYKLDEIEKILSGYGFFPYFYDPINRSVKPITKLDEGFQDTIYLRLNRENLVLLKDSLPIKIFGNSY